MLCSRLDWFVESNRRLSDAQSGFSRSKSTSDNVVALWSAVNLAFCKKEHLVAVFIDIKSAFDNVNIGLLSARLKLIGAPNNFCDLIFNLFYFKNLFVESDSGFVNVTSFTGVPQGCVLSPICFNIYINEIFKGLPRNVHVLGYADDVVVFCSDKIVENAIISLQIALDSINSKLTSLQLFLSPNKSKAMIFSKKIIFDHNLPRCLKICNNDINYVNSFNFLGFFFQSNLKLNIHVEGIVKKCSGFINVLRSLCGVSWGSDTRCLLLLFLGVIRPKIEYMAPLLLNCPVVLFKKLERIQWKCIRIALGAMQSTHTLGLEQLSNVMPLKERLILLSEGLVNKILSTEHHPAKPFILELIHYQNIPSFFKNLSSKLRLHNIVCPRLHYMFESPFYVSCFRAFVNFMSIKKKDSCSMDVVQKFNLVVNKYFKGFTKIYTDGSKNENRVGCGVWIPDLNIEAYFSLNCNCSIFSAEIRAIWEALNIIQQFPAYKKILIVSDSKSVLMALNSFSNSKSHHKQFF